MALTVILYLYACMSVPKNIVIFSRLKINHILIVNISAFTVQYHLSARHRPD
jgi:hypothetical protein